jgi:hypothetical protein
MVTPKERYADLKEESLFNFVAPPISLGGSGIGALLLVSI